MLGLVSDTHGLVRAEALTALQGCQRIIHAGDVGKSSVLDELNSIAPVDAVRGNVDRGDWAVGMPERRLITWHGLRIVVVHDVSDFDAGCDESVDLIVAGHSHRPYWGYWHGVRYINPGSIGPRRFRLPVTLARLRIVEMKVLVQRIVLDDRGAPVDWGPGFGEWVYPI